MVGSEGGTLLFVLVVVGLVKGGMALTLFALVLVVVRLLVLVLGRGVRARVLAKENGMRSSRRPGTYHQARTMGE